MRVERQRELVGTGVGGVEARSLLFTELPCRGHSVVKTELQMSQLPVDRTLDAKMWRDMSNQLILGMRDKLMAELSVSLQAELTSELRRYLDSRLRPVQQELSA